MGSTYEICSMLIFMIRSKGSLCQYFYLLSKNKKKINEKCFLVNSMFDMWPVCQGIGKADKYPVSLLQCFPGNQRAWGREGAVQLCSVLCQCSAPSEMLQVWMHGSCSSPCSLAVPIFRPARERCSAQQGLFWRLVQALSAGILNYHLFMILNVLSSPGSAI